MFGSPTLNLPTSVNYGDNWSGNIFIPTQWPVGVTMPPALPSLPVTLLAQLETPEGQRFNVGTATPSFQPGQALSVPVSFNTSQLAGPGSEKIFLKAQDLQGNNLLPGGANGLLLGMLNVLQAAAGALPTPAVPGVPGAGVLSQYGSVVVSMSPQTVKVGDTVNIPVTYTHIGAPETRTLYAAIGQNKGFFDEILHSEKSINVPLDAAQITRTENVPILITSALSPGTYGVFGKIKDLPGINILSGRQVVSPSVWNVITVIGATTLKVTNQPRSGGTLEFSFTGFQPNSQVTVGVQGGGQAAFQSNSSGAGSGRFTISEPPGSYTLFAKDSYGHSVTAPFTVLATAEASDIPRVDVALSATSVPIGGSLTIPFAYQHKGAQEQVTVYAAIGTGSTFGFDEKVHSTKSLTIPPDTNLTSRPDSISVPITTTLQPGVKYGVYVKLQRVQTGRGEVISPYKYDIVTITPAAGAAAGPTASASPSTAKAGQTVTISFSGFQPNSAIYTATRTIGNVNGNSNSQGAGSIKLSLPSNLPAGNYNTAVTDSAGHSAIARWTVS
jgi:hypothetical protein